MELKAKWHGAPFYDTSIRKWLVTFEVDLTPSEYDKTKDKPLSLLFKEFRQKRSLTANAYFHVLVDKIAETLGVTHTEIHNRMIADYGYKDDGQPCLMVRTDVEWERFDSIHLRPTTEFREEYGADHHLHIYQYFDVMRGSHTYDTKEMAHLIDGVVFEARSLGIETLSPDELERIKQQWNL